MGQKIESDQLALRANGDNPTAAPVLEDGQSSGYGFGAAATNTGEGHASRLATATLTDPHMPDKLSPYISAIGNGNQ